MTATGAAIRRGAVSPPVDNRRGALLLVAAAVFLTGEVVAVRLLDGRASNGQIVFFRGMVQLVVVAGWILWRQPRLFATRRPALHLVRGLTSLLCWWLYYQSFLLLDLALATVLTFTSSLFVVLLAGPVLGERVGRFRWGMTLLGFAGIALATAPEISGTVEGTQLVGIAAGIGSALAAAALIFQNRILARTEPTSTIMFYIALVASVATLPFVMTEASPIAAPVLLILLLSGAMGTTVMMLTIEAYRIGEVSALAPFPYLRLVFSAIAGLLLFAEWPGPLTWIGAGLIVLSAIVVTRRTAQKSGL